MKLESRDLQVLFLITILCLMVRLVFFTGIFINDDLQYIDHAEALARGMNIWAEGGSQLAFRLGMVLPLALSYLIFGYHEYSFVIYPILCSLGACMCIYIVAFRLWGLVPAALASLAWTFFPLQVCYDTQLSTSPQLALFVSLSFLLLIEARRAVDGTENRGRGNLLYFLCGISLGLGWIVSGLFVLVLFMALPILYFLKIPAKIAGLVLAGFMVVFLLEMIFCATYSGNALSRIASIQETEAEIESNRDPSYLPRVMFRIANTNFFDHEGHFGIQWYLFIAMTVISFLARERTCMALATGVWLMLAYLQWGVISPDWLPITKYIRYLSLSAPFICILTGWAFGRSSQDPGRVREVALLLFLAYCFHCTFVMMSVNNKNRALLYDYREAYRIITTRHLEEPVFTDFRTRHFMDIYSGKTLAVRDVELLINEPPPSNGTLLTNCSDISRNHGYREENMPWWYRVPPPSWRLFDEIMTRRTFEADLNPRIYCIKE